MSKIICALKSSLICRSLQVWEDSDEEARALRLGEDLSLSFMNEPVSANVKAPCRPMSYYL